MKEDPQAPFKPLDDYSSSQCLNCTSSETLSQNAPVPPPQVAPEFLTNRRFGLINICCFEPLSFKVICYTGIDSYLYKDIEEKRQGVSER